jgi:hypothetical protein
MPRFQPGHDRDRLRFVESVTEAFSFLETEYGLRQVEVLVTFVRYESDAAFAQVFHGRGSYELGVEIGLRAPERGSEIAYSLTEIVRARGGENRAMVRTQFAATSPEAVRSFLRTLADLTRQYATEELIGNREGYRLLAKVRAADSQKLSEGWEAKDLRAAAESAWRQQDFRSVCQLYGKLMELRTVVMEASERKRFQYARRHLEDSE